MRLGSGSWRRFTPRISAALLPIPLVQHNQLYHSFSTGDVNGDGFDEALVTFFPIHHTHGGYPTTNDNHALYAGSGAGLGTSAVQTFEGTSRARFVGDLNGDG